MPSIRAIGAAASRGLRAAAGRREAVSAVYVTVPSRDVGRSIASSLLSARLVACVNIIPGVESLYTWNGKVEMDNELMLMAKTQTSLVEQVAKHVEDKHPYDVPEVIAVPVDNDEEREKHLEKVQNCLHDALKKLSEIDCMVARATRESGADAEKTLEAFVVDLARLQELARDSSSGSASSIDLPLEVMARVDRGENPDTFAAERVMRAASTREEATTKGAALDAMREALLEKARTLYPDEVDAYVTLRGLDVQGAGEHKRRKKKG